MLFISILTLLLSNAVSSRRDKSILYSRITTMILISCFILTAAGPSAEFYDKGIGLFGGLYHTTAISHLFHIFIFIITLFILQLNSFYPRQANANIATNNIYIPSVIKVILLNKMSQQYKIIEYPLIMLFVLIGGLFLICSSDLISIFLSIELQSYALYILCAIYRNSERATSAALTYFLLGGLSSCFILLGASLTYGNSGNTGFDGLYIINNVSTVNDSFEKTGETLLSIYKSNYFNFALTILAIGFLFKISAAPFHFWSPDVYDAVPTIVTSFVAVFAKISIFILLLELVHFTTSMYVSDFEVKNFSVYLDNSVNISWTFTFLISSLLSLIIGAVLGLVQSRIKRLYAYSTISHLGFILLAITINSVESTQSFIFYLMQYSISNVNAFLLLIAIGYILYLYVEDKDNSAKSEESSITTGIAFASSSNPNSGKDSAPSKDDRHNSPIQLISDIKGFFYINPSLSISLAITLFSFIGIPPLIGFFAKQMVLVSALDNGYVFMAIVAILASVISAYYYLVVIKQIFFEKTSYILNPNLKGTISSSDIHLTGAIAGIISFLTLIILFFILFPQEWLNMTTILSLIIFNF